MTAPMTRKLCGGISCDAEGSVEAVVAKLDSVDLDGDVTLRDAIPNGSPVLLSEYGHSAILAQQSGVGLPVAPPVGKGEIHIEGDQAVFRGRFFPSSRGEEARIVTREMGNLQQWSWSFRLLESEPASGLWREMGARRVLKRVEAFEASPVTLGAGGRQTRTVSVKGSCGCSDRSKLPDPAEVAQLAADIRRTLARAEALREPRGALALDIAEKATRWLTGGRVQRPPSVKFFDYDPNERQLGFYDPGTPDVIYVCRGLSDTQLIRTIGHEVSHHLSPLDCGEAIAVLDGERVLTRHLASLEEG